MLHCMRHPQHIISVTITPNVDIHRRARLVCICVMGQQHLQLVGELDHSVGTAIERWLLQLSRQELCAGLRVILDGSGGGSGCGRSHDSYKRVRGLELPLELRIMQLAQFWREEVATLDVHAGTGANVWQRASEVYRERT